MIIELIMMLAFAPIVRAVAVAIGKILCVGASFWQQILFLVTVHV